MRARDLVRRFAVDRHGYVLVLSAFAMVPLIGMGALVVDIARQQNASTDLQSIIDASALAGAHELDGTADGLVAAEAAVRAYLATQPRHTDALATAAAEAEILFFTGAACTTPTTDAAFADCVQVTSTVHTMATTLAAFLGLEQLWARASATAESRLIACEVPPLMMCNPAEITSFVPVVGQQFMLVPENGGPSEPGNFGLLDPPFQDSSGASTTGPLLASASPNFCYSAGVSVATGLRNNPVKWGVNTRFDMYPTKEDFGSTTDPVGYNHPPAPNVAKGIVMKPTGQPGRNGAQCRADKNATSNLMAFPRDTATTRVFGSVTVGNGIWNREAYWSTNHPDLDTDPNTSKPPRPDGWNTWTRFDTYLWELGVADENDAPATPASNLPVAGTESAQPICYPHLSGSTAVGLPTRRVIYTALINCKAEGISGNSVTRSIPREYWKFFITEPSEGGEIRAEFIGRLEPNDDSGKLRQVVQLVRACRIPRNSTEARASDCPSA